MSDEEKPKPKRKYTRRQRPVIRQGPYAEVKYVGQRKPSRIDGICAMRNTGGIVAFDVMDANGFQTVFVPGNGVESIRVFGIAPTGSEQLQRPQPPQPYGYASPGYPMWASHSPEHAPSMASPAPVEYNARTQVRQVLRAVQTPTGPVSEVVGEDGQVIAVPGGFIK